MSIQHFSTSDVGKLATGMSRAELSRLSWSDISALQGIVRTRVLTDLERAGITCYVRLNPELWKRFNGGKKPIRFECGDLDSLELTDEWQPVRAALAALLHVRLHEDATLGAATMKMTRIDDGYGGKQLVPEAVPAVEGLIEFAAHADRAKTMLTLATA